MSTLSHIGDAKTNVTAAYRKVLEWRGDEIVEDVIDDLLIAQTQIADAVDALRAIAKARGE